MKVLPKNINLRNDCFAAEEKDISIRIESHHHRVWVTIENEITGALMQADLSFNQLAYLLSNADKLERE